MMTHHSAQLTIPTPTTQASARPRLKLGVRPVAFLGLTALLVSVFLLAVAWGSVSIPLDQILTVLTGGDAEKTAWTQIILKVRIPRALASVLAGMALSVGGIMMQTFFRNPLADPFILGISSGASLGVALLMMLAGTGGGALLAGLGLVGDAGLAISASLGAGVTMLIVLFIARKVASPTILLVLGLMFGYFTGALVSFLMHFSLPEKVQAFVNWGFGTFDNVAWGQMGIFGGAVLIGLAVAMLLAKPLNALALGETYAQSMGVNVRLARLGIISATGLLAGAVTAFCGPIGFIGVAVPHVCRVLFRTADHRTLIPAVALMGASVALVAGIIAELPNSTLTLPLNAVTALFGAPVVVWVILKQR